MDSVLLLHSRYLTVGTSLLVCFKFHSGSGRYCLRGWKCYQNICHGNCHDPSASPCEFCCWTETLACVWFIDILRPWVRLLCENTNSTWSFHIPTTAIDFSTCTVKWHETKNKQSQVFLYILTCWRLLIDDKRLYVVVVRMAWHSIIYINISVFKYF